MSDEEEILRMLQGDDSGSKAEDDVSIPTEIPVTRAVLDTAARISELVREKEKKPYEWPSVLLAVEGDPEFVARDLIIPYDSRVGEHYVRLPGEGYAKVMGDVVASNRANGTQWFDIGWLHSHGSGMTGFSTTDSDDFKTVLNRVYPHTTRTSRGILNLIEGDAVEEVLDDRLVVTGSKVTDAIIEYAHPSAEQILDFLRAHGLTLNDTAKAVDRTRFAKDLAQLVNMRTYEKRVIGFGYSIVVNDKGDKPHAELGIVEQQPFFNPQNITIRTQKVGLHVIDSGEGILHSDVEIQEWIDKRLIFEKWYMSGRRALSAIGRRFFGRGQATLDERVASNVTGVDGGSWEGYASQGVITSGASYQRPTITKDGKDELSKSEIVDLFIYRVGQYFALARMPGHVFVDYLDELLQVHNHRRKWQSLADVVLYIGELATDDDVIIEPMPPYRLLGLRYDLQSEDDPLTIDFMLQAVLEGVNVALPKYVDAVLKRGPSVPPAPTIYTSDLPGDGDWISP